MSLIKKWITKLFFGNKYALGIAHIGKNSKVGLLHNFLNGQYITIGDRSCVGRFSKLQCFDHFNGVEYHPTIQIGNDCLLGQNVSILSADTVIIEDKVTLASYITIVNENHGMNPEDPQCYRYQTLTSAPIIIKEGTWIGERCNILPGVTIGKKCVIGSGSVVNKSVPDYCMAVGNPARVIKKYNFDTHRWERYSGE